MTDNLSELISKIDETLEYHYDEYPPDTYKHVWDLPFCIYAKGVTPNHLKQIKDILNEYEAVCKGLEPAQGKVTGEPEGEIVVMEETPPKHKLDMVLVSDYFDGPFSIRVLTNNINKYLSEGYELYGYPFVWENGLAQIMIKKIKIEE